MTARLKQKYQNEVVKALRDNGAYKNVMEIPRVTKVVVNMGVKATVDRDSLKLIAEDMEKITGQKPIIVKSKKAIANFKLRIGMPIGVKVTLRGERMYEFLERLISAALPRIRDFRGISGRSFDGRGNYSLGLREQVLFPEIDPDKLKVSQGMDITIVTTAKTNDQAKQLLTLLGMPFEVA